MRHVQALIVYLRQHELFCTSVSSRVWLLAVFELRTVLYSFHMLCRLAAFLACARLVAAVHLCIMMMDTQVNHMLAIFES